MRIARIFITGLFLFGGLLPLRADAATGPFTKGVIGPVFSTNGLLVGPGSTESIHVISLFQETLFSWQRGEPIPVLAESIPKRDGDVYEIRVRSDVSWHDGVKFTVDDVIYAMTAALSPELNSPYAPTMRGVLADSPTAIAKLDENRMRIQAAPGVSDDQFMRGVAIPILPRHIWETVALSEWATHPGSTGRDPSKVIGTGQFRFVQRTQYRACEPVATPTAAGQQPDEEIIFAKNADFTRTPVFDDFDSYRVVVFGCSQDDVDESIERLSSAFTTGGIDGFPAIDAGLTDNTFEPIVVVSEEFARELSPDVEVVSLPSDAITIPTDSVVVSDIPSIAISSPDAVSANEILIGAWVELEE